VWAVEWRKGDGRYDSSIISRYVQATLKWRIPESNWKAHWNRWGPEEEKERQEKGKEGCESLREEWQKGEQEERGGIWSWPGCMGKLLHILIQLSGEKKETWAALVLVECVEREEPESV
jgi:hypothetical protein